MHSFANASMPLKLFGVLLLLAVLAVAPPRERSR